MNIGQDVERFSVELGTRSYDIVISAGLLHKAGQLLRSVRAAAKVFIVTDKHVEAIYGAALLNALQQDGYQAQLYAVPPGEASKDFSTLEQLLEQLISKGLQRKDIVLALGGGVIGDLAGFAAAVALRGVDFVQIPTTLLAQVDSSVGGKTGINSKSGKNLIGAFHQPRLVVIDPDLLDTLNMRQLRAGYAEIVKMGMIKDADFFNWLEKEGPDVLKNTPARQKAISHSCRMKADIVARDERESGERMLLNFGHTFGHALEAAAGYSDSLLHGEAVAIGMAMAARFSITLGLCRAEDALRIERHLLQMGLPVKVSALNKSLSVQDIIGFLMRDKKAGAGQQTFILLKAIGEAFVKSDIGHETLNAFLGTEVAKNNL